MCTISENHIRLDDFGSNGIGLSDDSSEGHSRVADQTVLDLTGSDTISGTAYDVICKKEREGGREINEWSVGGMQVVRNRERHRERETPRETERERAHGVREECG